MCQIVTAVIWALEKLANKLLTQCGVNVNGNGNLDNWGGYKSNPCTSCRRAKNDKTTVQQHHIIYSFKWKYFSYFSTKTCCVYSLEVPHSGTSNKYPQHIYLRRISIKKISIHFGWKQLLWILNRRVLDKALLMSTHNMFLWRNKENINIF